MNYIKQLQLQTQVDAVEKEALRDVLNEIKSYCQSDKFRLNTTVQVNDILLRIEQGLRTVDEKLESMEINID
jgi:hypothetical protein